MGDTLAIGKIDARLNQKRALETGGTALSWYYWSMSSLQGDWAEAWRMPPRH